MLVTTAEINLLAYQITTQIRKLRRSAALTTQQEEKKFQVVEICHL